MNDWRLSATAVVLLVVAAGVLLTVSRADAAAYYVGGGEGVRLAIRVVNRQVVWAKVRVREPCFGNGVANPSSVERFEGMVSPVHIGAGGSFRWARDERRETASLRQVSRQDIGGRIGPRRLTGRLLYFLHFKSHRSSEAATSGTCWSGSGARRPRRIAVPIVARRRSEPPGLGFYYGAEKGGIATYFEVEGRRIVRSEVTAVHFCTSRRGRRYVERESRPFLSPIEIHPSGAFEVYEPSTDEIRPLEDLRGEVEAGRIVGTYGFAQGFAEGRCRTGSFEPGPPGSWALPFVAPLR